MGAFLEQYHVYPAALYIRFCSKQQHKSSPFSINKAQNIKPLRAYLIISKKRKFLHKKIMVPNYQYVTFRHAYLGTNTFSLWHHQALTLLVQVFGQTYSLVVFVKSGLNMYYISGGVG